jgi:hypothetical protein
MIGLQIDRGVLYTVYIHDVFLLALYNGDGGLRLLYRRDAHEWKCCILVLSSDDTNLIMSPVQYMFKCRITIGFVPIMLFHCGRRIHNYPKA